MINFEEQFDKKAEFSNGKRFRPDLELSFNFSFLFSKNYIKSLSFFRKFFMCLFFYLILFIVFLFFLIRNIILFNWRKLINTFILFWKIGEFVKKTFYNINYKI